MLKKILILLAIIFAEQAMAMNSSIKVKNNDITIINRQDDIKEFLRHIMALPTDIKRYIIQFFPFNEVEFEDEFITRTKTITKKNLPTKYYYINLKEPGFNQGSRGRLNIWTNLCPHKVYAAVLNGNHLQIINSSNDSIVYTETLHAPQDYTHVTVSSNAAMFATIHRQRDTHFIDEHNITRGTVDTITHILTIKNIANQKTETIQIPHQFHLPKLHDRSPTLSFKKEGTHIILHGKDWNQPKKQQTTVDKQEESKIPHHIIIPVSLNQQATYLNKQTWIFLTNRMLPKSVTNNIS